MVDVLRTSNVFQSIKSLYALDIHRTFRLQYTQQLCQSQVPDNEISIDESVRLFLNIGKF
jgi:hypothetical protein